MSPNLFPNKTRAYLLQHAGNGVHWYQPDTGTREPVHNTQVCGQESPR